jgi:hypothetical protein
MTTPDKGKADGYIYYYRRPPVFCLPGGIALKRTGQGNGKGCICLGYNSNTQASATGITPNLFGGL